MVRILSLMCVLIWGVGYAAERPNVIITGGAGYIGSHACKAFYQAGYTPITFDDLSTGNRDNVQWGPFEQGSILDQQKLLEVFAHYKPIGVCHFAGVLDVGESVDDPIKYYRANVVGSLNVIEASVKTQTVKGMVFSSSCSVYGDQTLDQPVTETLPTNPKSPYAQTKLDVENMLQWISKTYSFPAVCLRYFNVAGADPERNTGFSKESKALIPTLLRSSHNNTTFKIFGDDYPTRDGTCVRDFIHVTDLADAHVKAFEYAKNTHQFDIFGLGSEKGFTVKEILFAAKQQGINIQSETTKRRPGDIISILADSTKARSLLNWQPTHSTIEGIILTSYQWSKK